MLRRQPRIAALLFACSVALMGQQANQLTDQEKTQGWQLLFDGKTLKNWHSAPPPAPRAGGQAKQATAAQGGAAPKQASARGGLPSSGSNPDPCKTDQSAGLPPGYSHWEVLDGAIVGCGETSGYLDSDQSYKNFMLTIEFKTGPDTNSGVFIRAPQGTDGYEVNIWREQPAGYTTGSIVSFARTDRHFDYKSDEWNRMDINGDGDHLVVFLNGEKTVDTHDGKFPEGHLKLQYFKFPLAFRNIKIRVLP